MFEYVTASVTGNRDAFYINPCTCNAFVNPRKALNADVLQLDGVNHVCIEAYADGSFKVFQASGYSYERGMFLDMY